MSAPHNKLQSECFLWAFNERPQTRQLMFSSTNNLSTQLDAKGSMAKMSQLKALGVVKGVTDLVFFWSGRLFGMDIKIGRDKFSKEQNEFVSKLRENGGNGFEIRSLEQFKEEIDCILTNGCLTSEL